MATLEVDAPTGLGDGGPVPPPPAHRGWPRLLSGPLRSRRLQGVGWLMLVVSRLLWPLAPASAEPAVTVTPSTGITDGQELTVAYTGFSPNVTVQITECKVGAIAYNQCDNFPQISNLSDAAGSGSVKFPAKRLPDDAFGGTIICDAINLCQVTVFERTDTFTPRASVPITFASSENSPTTTTTPPVGATTTVPGAITTTTTALTGTTTSISAGGATSTTLSSGVTTTSSAAGGVVGSTTTSTTTGGVGSTTTSTTLAGGTTTSTSAAGGVLSPGAADTSSDALAFTGTSLIAPLLALTGALMIAVGTAVRSRSRVRP